MHWVLDRKSRKIKKERNEEEIRQGGTGNRKGEREEHCRDDGGSRMGEWELSKRGVKVPPGPWYTLP